MCGLPLPVSGFEASIVFGTHTRSRGSSSDPLTWYAGYVHQMWGVRALDNLMKVKVYRSAQGHLSRKSVSERSVKRRCEPASRNWIRGIPSRTLGL